MRTYHLSGHSDGIVAIGVDDPLYSDALAFTRRHINTTQRISLIHSQMLYVTSLPRSSSRVPAPRTFVWQESVTNL